MAIQFSVLVRNARLDAIESAIAHSAILRIRTGSQPANCAAANTGTILSEVSLPNNWLADASNGTKVITGTWQDLSVDANGTAAHFRLYDNTGTTCHMQGTITATGGGGDMTVNDVNFLIGQIFTVTAFTITDGNA